MADDSFVAKLIATPQRRWTLLLLALGAALYVPFAGNYGMWDPWETHYGEVARQMLERNDFVSQWWPGSPQDRAEFWSKPVFTFWLLALGMKLVGLEWHPGAPPDEMVTSWRAEWGSRMPILLLGILGAWAVYELTRRLVGKRAGLLAGLVLLTSSQWALISRQAMTDMPFVAPMTVALALAGLALLLPASEVEAELPRKAWRIGKLDLSYPIAPAFRWFFWSTVLLVVPQLLVISIQVVAAVHVGSYNVRLSGFVPMLPYWIATFGALYWCARAKNLRQIYLFLAYVMCGVASLAKGPAGIAIPAIIMIVYLLVSSRLGDVITKLEIPRGVLLFVATAFPWYHAMLIRHGMGFWNEFIGDNYVHRASGRHGDRGTFEYYVQYIGYGMFPWSGFVAVGSIMGFRYLREAGPRARLAMYALVWALVDWVLVTLVNTKFHHYILPALPALAILAALAIDELFTQPARALRAALIVVGVPVTLICARDLAAFPARLLWMFNYDYVNMPGTGRPWPTVAQYGQRYEYGTVLLSIGLVCVAAMLLAVWVTRRSDDASEAEEPTPSVGRWLGGAALVVGLLAVAILAGPATPRGAAPKISPYLWLAPTACMVPIVVFVALAISRGLGAGARVASVVLGICAAVWTGAVIDKVLVELSPHWAQKHVIAAYYSHRQSPKEKLIAWQLYWRGENFYSKNEIYDNPDQNERTVFLGDHNVEKMQKWFTTHKGERVFFIVERVRYESLRGTLPAASKSTLTIVDDTNNKLYLAMAQL